MKSVFYGLLREFQDGNIPKMMAIVSNPIPNIPSAHWSLFNRLLQKVAHTSDGRDITQWNGVGRNVKEGSQAFHIFVPNIIKIKGENGEIDDEIIGCKLSPVFRIEDTEGEPVDHEDIQLRRIPFVERLEGLSSKSIPFGNKLEQIIEATPEEALLFYELAYAIQETVAGHDILSLRLKKIEVPIKEMVTELSALTLCYLAGKDGSKYLGSTYCNIDEYAKGLNITPGSAMQQVIGEIERVLEIFLTDMSISLNMN